MRHPNASAFTLVELLVVVAIIVVLMALLTPALDKAVYEAQMAQCAANQRGIGSSASVYATANRRFYPFSAYPRIGSQPHAIGAESSAQEDLRKALQSYVPLKIFLDPFTKSVDLSFEANDADTQVLSSYQFWFGWRYGGDWGGPGMRKIGDRVHWIDDLDGTKRQLSHSFLVTGLLSVRNTNGAETSHPDSDGVEANHVSQNQDWFLGTEAGVLKITVSQWDTTNVVGPRGTVDQNFGWADGSVRRYNKITGQWNNVEAEDGTIFYAAPWYNNSNTTHNVNMRFLPVN